MKIALFGSYGRSNIGDESIADGIHRMIHTIRPDAELTLFSHNVSESENLHPQFKRIMPMIATGVRSFLRQWLDKTWQKAKQILHESDYIIIGGGGIFHDHETGQKGLNPLFIWWLRTIFFSSFKKPILIWAVGIGPIHNKDSDFWLKGILKRANVITVRDESSAELARKLVSQEITVVPDPVWGLFSASSDTKQNTSLAINIRENKRFNFEQIKAQLLKAVRQLQNQHKFTAIKFIPFALYQPDDTELMEQLVPVLTQTFNLPVTIEKPTSPKSAFQLIENCSAMIAMRFHSYIFAVSAKCPCTLLSYSAKTDAITQYTLAENLIRQEKTTAFWRQIFNSKH